MMMTWNRVKVPCNFFDIIYGGSKHLLAAQHRKTF